MRPTYAVLFSSLLLSCTSTGNLPTRLEDTLALRYRSEQNLPRDAYRHPLQTLQFFGIKPNMTVVEIWPGTGWYSEILAPYLTSDGHYIAAVVPPEKSDYAKKNYDTLTNWGQSHPEVKMELTSFSPPELVQFAKPESVDMVLTFRNVHNWLANNAADQTFAAFYSALKPGGILGVVEHRQDEKAPTDPKAKSGYVKTSEIIRMATQAGFKLDAQSEINANPKDTKDYPEGVWTLPPTLKLKEQDKAKYMAIGESDRMTLRFIKPKK